MHIEKKSRKSRAGKQKKRVYSLNESGLRIRQRKRASCCCPQWYVSSFFYKHHKFTGLETEGHLYLLFLRNVVCFRVIEISEEQEDEKFFCKKTADGPVVSIDTFEGTRTYDVAEADCNEGPVQVAALKSRQETGRVFSRLPLSDIQSKCGVHVSGLFWASQDRRTILLHEDTGGSAREWSMANRTILSTLGGSLLFDLLERRTSETSTIATDLFPFFDAARPEASIGFELAKCFFDNLEHHPAVNATIAGGQISSWNFLYYLGTEDPRPDLPSSILSTIGIPVVELDDNLHRNYTAKSLGIELTPEALRTWLRNNSVKVPSDMVLSLLNYCISDGRFDDLFGCPLCLTYQGSVSKFGDGLSLFVCTKEVQKKLVMNHFPEASCVVDVPLDQARKLVETRLVKDVDGRCMVKLISDIGVDVFASEGFQRDFWDWFLDQNISEELLSDLDSCSHFRVLPVWEDSEKKVFKTFGNRGRIFLGEQWRSLCRFLRRFDAFVYAGDFGKALMHRQIMTGVEGTVDLARIILSKLDSEAVDAIEFLSDERAMWRQVLQRLASIDASSLRSLNRWDRLAVLPMVKCWPGTDSADLFPCNAFRALFPIEGVPAILRDSLSSIPLPLFYETDSSILNFLCEFSIETAPIESVLIEHILPKASVFPRVMEIIVETELLEEAHLAHVKFIEKSGIFLSPAEAVHISDFRSFDACLKFALPDSWARDRVKVARLRRLGMREELSANEVRVVAQHIASVRSTELSSLFAKYLRQHSVDVSSVQDVAWIACEPRPSGWTFPWKGDMNFCRITDGVVGVRHQDLLGCVRPVATILADDVMEKYSVTLVFVDRFA